VNCWTVLGNTTEDERGSLTLVAEAAAFGRV
jgi:hypothetical protein